MNLDKLQINAYIRSGWQAVDLGFLMASAWWRSLFLAGAVPALILFIPLLIVFSENPVWAGIITWWLKPFWERLPLYLASRKLFDEETLQIGIFSQLATLYKKESFAWLLWRRFSIQRAFDAPVTVLEELKSSQRRSRLNVLHGKYSDVALGNQFVCFFFEILVTFGIVLLLAFFIPDSFGFETHDSVDDLTQVGLWLYTLSAFAAMILVMPFHTMAGFALYLNRRIELEAWDIEISFRNLAARKQSSGNAAVSMVLAMTLLTLVASITPSASYAATNHDKASAKQLIEEVFQGDSFGQEKTVQKWRFKNWFDDWYVENEDKIPEWIIDLLEWLLKSIVFSDSQSGESHFAAWIKFMLVAIFVVVLIFLFHKFRGPLSRLGKKQKAEVPPEVLFGLDVTPESLPTDVPGQVLAIWQGGNYRDSLGLLYRATLSRLIDKHQLAFRASHTEAECVALVRVLGIESLSVYFSKLTNVWRRLAYGHLPPENETMQSLCEAWSKELSNEPG